MASPRIRQSILVFLLFVCIILSSGCIIRREVTPGIGPGDLETCSLRHITERGEEYFAATDPCYFRDNSPLDFLNELRQHPDNVVLILEAPADWIKREVAGELMQLIDSEESAAPVVSLLSSYMPFNQTSTVGNEALFLLEGYRRGWYPPALCSLYYFSPNRTEIRSWWDTYGREGLIEETTAVSLVQITYPELRSYPSDDLPPRSIRTERVNNGWFIAFIQEGSGVPIISARCYFVGNNRELTQVGDLNHSIMVLPDEFSAQKCR